jgi:hypothetical protein
MVLGWFELLDEERPPERIWLDDEALRDHFHRVDEARKNGGKFEEVPDFDMQQNELTADFKK